MKTRIHAFRIKAEYSNQSVTMSNTCIRAIVLVCTDTLYALVTQGVQLILSCPENNILIRYVLIIIYCLSRLHFNSWPFENWEITMAMSATMV